ncbi:hypothetical protein C7M84_017752 [Penaeus vannamei]|uniref:Uncharacterized protein n=1 Tax=Penaeus vannamei TaxID=6689 RepID=A0A423SJC5_PENVA|nr:hypothetical protein C7M84_017752 [Penaeus vannamei]
MIRGTITRGLYNINFPGRLERILDGDDEHERITLLGRIIRGCVWGGGGDGEGSERCEWTVTGSGEDAPPVQRGRFDPTLAGSSESQHVTTYTLSGTNGFPLFSVFAHQSDDLTNSSRRYDLHTTPPSIEYPIPTHTYTQYTYSHTHTTPYMHLMPLNLAKSTPHLCLPLNPTYTLHLSLFDPHCTLLTLLHPLLLPPPSFPIPSPPPTCLAFPSSPLPFPPSPISFPFPLPTHLPPPFPPSPSLPLFPTSLPHLLYPSSPLSPPPTPLHSPFPSPSFPLPLPFPPFPFPLPPSPTPHLPSFPTSTPLPSPSPPSPPPLLPHFPSPPPPPSPPSHLPTSPAAPSLQSPAKITPRLQIILSLIEWSPEAARNRKWAAGHTILSAGVLAQPDWKVDRLANPLGRA